MEVSQDVQTTSELSASYSQLKQSDLREEQASQPPLWLGKVPVGQHEVPYKVYPL